MCISEVDNILYFLHSSSSYRTASSTLCCWLTFKKEQHQQSHYPSLWTVLLPVYVFSSVQSLSAFDHCHPLYVSLLFFFLTLVVCVFLSVFHSLSLSHSHTLPPSLHLPVKRCSFLLVVIKSKVGSIREPVFESSSGCQRAFIPWALDVPLMASLCLSWLPTMPLLIHQPITALRHCGPQNAFFVCVKVPTLGERERRPKT